MWSLRSGTGGRTRTDTLLPELDFECSWCILCAAETLAFLASQKNCIAEYFAVQRVLKVGTGSRTRTDTLSPELDFESSASTNSAIPATLYVYIT